MRLTEVKPEHLHEVWPFLKRGLDDIHKRLKPDWISENVFTALTLNNATALLIARSHPLGFIIYYKQLRPFSQKPDLFVWAAWALPIREQQNGDNVAEAVAAGWNYLCDVAKSAYGTDTISWITSRRRALAFQRKYGWEPKWAVYNVNASS